MTYRIELSFDMRKTKNVTESVRLVMSVPSYELSEGDYRFYSLTMMILCAYAFVISFLFEVMGIHQ